MTDNIDLKLLIPGAIQGFTRSIISYPFEVIKTQMQIKNKGIIYIFKDIYKNDIKKFYRGILVPLTTIPLERSLQFYIYEKNKNNNSLLYNSFLTSIITNSIFTPLSILNVHVINSNKNNYKNIFNFIKNNNLKKVIYKGLFLEISKNYISTFTYFYIYSSSKKYLVTDNLLIGSFISGIFASICVWGIILPLDTVKIKYQVGNISLLQTLYSFKNIKITNLWKGYTPIILRTCPSSGFGMLAYEYTKYKLNIK